MSSPALLRAPERTPEAFDVDAVMAELEARVAAVDPARLRHVLTQPPMVSYGDDVLDDVLAQRPDATRIAGRRAWANRGRRVKPDATAIRVGAGKRLYAPAVHPRTGTVITNARVARKLGLQPTLLGYQRTQDVYDISDTEPLDAPKRADAELRAARRLSADLVAAAERAGVQAHPGGVRRPVSETHRLINRSLLEHRYGEGVHGEIHAAGGRRVRYVATPGGMDPVADALALAPEVGHARIGHLDVPDVIRRLEADDHELEAEAFAYALARSYGIDSASSAEYLASYSQTRHWARKRAMQTAARAVEAFRSEAVQHHP